MSIIAASWIGAGTLIEPDFLVLIAGPFTIASMYLFTLVVGTMNVRPLPAALAPSVAKRIGLVWAATLWGWFIAEQVSRTMLGLVGAPAGAIETIAWHPVRVAAYGMWIASLVWFAWAVLRTRRGSVR